MSRQPVLADVGTIDQATFNHIPAEQTLKTTKQEDQNKPRYHGPADPSLNQEEKEGQYKHHSHSAAPKAMDKFQPENGFETFHIHSEIDFFVLGRLFVQVEHGLPFGVVQRRQPAGYGTPIHHRETRMSKPRYAAQDDHDKHHSAHDKKPVGDDLRLPATAGL